MSQTTATASSPSPPSFKFLPVFAAALEAYEKTTKYKLLTHPLAAQLQSCDSPADVLSVLQDLIQQFDQSSSSDRGLGSWLGPTVNVLFAFSAALSEGVGLVCFQSPSHENLKSDIVFPGILAFESDICRDRSPSFGEYSPRFLGAGSYDYLIC